MSLLPRFLLFCLLILSIFLLLTLNAYAADDQMVVLRRGRNFIEERDNTWPAGLRRMTLTIHDQHYQNNNGEWQPVIEDFEDEPYVEAGITFNWVAQRVRFLLRVAADGTRRIYPDRNDSTRYIQFGRPQYWNGSKWLNLVLGRPSRAGNTITWDQPTYALTLTITWRKVIPSITLKTPTAPHRFRFPISLVGLTYENGKLKSGNHILGTVNSNAINANGLELPVNRIYIADYLEFSPINSVAWRNNAVYPIKVIAPNDTFTSSQTSTDKFTDIQAENPTTNYGTNILGHTGQEADNADYRRILLEIDTSSIPASSTCISATLTLTRANADANNRAHSVYELLSGRDGWTEGGATWNTYDGSNNWGTAGCANTSSDRSSAALGTFNSPSSSNTTVDITLTASAVQSWFGASNSNYGVLIKDDTETSWAKTEWCSDDNSTQNYRPKLVVVYDTGTSLFIQ